MSAHNDGGPAFPEPIGDTFGRSCAPHPGMSLCDYFAANANEADIAQWMPTTVGEALALARRVGIDPNQLAHVVHAQLRAWARYQHADAMLEAREK